MSEIWTVYKFEEYELKVIGNKTKLYARDSSGGAHYIHLDPVQCCVLLELLRNPLTTMSAGQLADHGDVNRAIFELRPKLHDSSDEQRLIETVTDEQKRGYRFKGEVQVISEDDLPIKQELSLKVAEEQTPFAQALDMEAPTVAGVSTMANELETKNVQSKTNGPHAVDQEVGSPTNEENRESMSHGMLNRQMRADTNDKTVEQLSIAQKEERLVSDKPHGEDRALARSKEQPETFEDWLWRRPGIFVLAFLLAAVVITLYVSFSYSHMWDRPDDKVALENARRAAAYAQFSVITVLFLLALFWSRAKGFDPNRKYSAQEVRKAGYKDVADFQKDSKVLKSDFMKHKLSWLGLLLTWIPLYILFARANLETDKARGLLIFFNVLNTTVLVIAFTILNKNSGDPNKRRMPAAILNFLVFLILFLALGILIQMQKYDGAILLTGIASGVFMALYVGRLQSKFMGPEMWVFYLLYSYTAIQPLVLYLKDQPKWAWIIIDATLLLKCLLYLYMAWLFQSGFLLFYLARVKRESGTVKKQRDAFRALLK